MSINIYADKEIISFTSFYLVKLVRYLGFGLSGIIDISNHILCKDNL
jgi:hypothetical protein